MKESSDDFSTKSCICGSIMEQVVGFNHRSTDDTISRIESDGTAPIAKHSIRLYCASGSCL